MAVVRPGEAAVAHSPSDRPVDVQAAFAELAGITLADSSIGSVMETIAGLSKRNVPGADEVSVTFIENGRPTTVAATGQLARDLDERQYERGYGPCVDGTAAGETVHVPAMESEQRWPDWAAAARRTGARSSLTVPVPLQREVSAALNIYSMTPDVFDTDSQEIAATFAAYAGVALANMHLYESQARVAQQLTTAMQSRAVIDQAKGVLMGTRRCSAEEAFEILVDLSQRSNRKLRDVAQALVDNAERPDAGA